MELMIKSMFKRKGVKILTVILAILTIGISYYNYTYYRIKQIIIHKIEAQITEMEKNGIDNPSYQENPAITKVNRIEDKKFMIKIISNLKPNRIRDLIPNITKPTNVFIEIGDVSMGVNGNNYWFTPYNRTSFKMIRKDQLAIEEFKSNLEQRKWENEN